MSVSHCPQSLVHAQSRAAKSYLSTPYLTATSLLLLLHFYSSTFFYFSSHDQNFAICFIGSLFLQVNLLDPNIFESCCK